MRPSDDPPYSRSVDFREAKADWMLTTNAERFLAPDNAKAAGEVIITMAWKRTRPRAIKPAERWICRKVLKETPRVSARKLKCRPRNRATKLISKRLPARTPAIAMLETRKLRQKELPPMYTS
jgi:hypothetical protein